MAIIPIRHCRTIVIRVDPGYKVFNCALNSRENSQEPAAESLTTCGSAAWSNRRHNGSKLERWRFARNPKKRMRTFPIGGTAPLMSALVALLNQELGKPVGFWNPQLYQAIGTAAFRDITSGNNGAYAAAKGWDACWGVGVPVGTALASALKGQSAKATSHARSGHKA